MSSDDGITEPAFFDSMYSDDQSTEPTSVAEYYRRFFKVNEYFQNHERVIEDCRDREFVYTQGVKLWTYFENAVLPGLQADLNESLGFTMEEPWLGDFTKENGGFGESLAFYAKEPTRLATALQEFAEFLYCETIQYRYGKLDSTPDTGFQNSEFLQFITPIVPTLGCDDDELRRRNEMIVPFSRFIHSLNSVSANHEWGTLVHRVKEFAEVVGYRESSEHDAVRDVFTYVNYIHGKALESTNNQQISALEAKLAILTQEKEEYLEQSRTQNRILVSLNIRHILERLPPRSSKTEKNNWESFWKMAVDKAMGNKSTPLSKLIDSYALHNDKNSNAPPNVENIKKTGGANLYGSLSTNIHQFKGEYNLEKDQWNALDFDILQAIRPLPENIYFDGSIDWEAERQRFIPGYKEEGSEEIEKSDKRVEKSDKKVRKSDEKVKKNGEGVEKCGEGVEKRSKRIEKNSTEVEKSSEEVKKSSKGIEKSSEGVREERRGSRKLQRGNRKEQRGSTWVKRILAK